MEELILSAAGDEGVRAFMDAVRAGHTVYGHPDTVQQLRPHAAKLERLGLDPQDIQENKYIPEGTLYAVAPTLGWFVEGPHETP